MLLFTEIVSLLSIATSENIKMEQIFTDTKAKKNIKKRPYTHRQISNIKILSDALHWRKSLIRDIIDRHDKMFDPLLSQDKLQEYNDQLNIWFKQLKMWDWHVKNNLHGRISHDNVRLYTQLKNGKLILGKWYYGRAIELPEIKDHLDKQSKKRLQVERWIDIKKINLNNKKYLKTSSQLIPQLEKFEEYWTPIIKDINHISNGSESISKTSKFSLTQNVASQEELESWLVERRKKKLLEQLNL